MLPVTQAEIDEAVLIGKYATYTLAAEIALEAKYGGKTECCKKRLKLIHIFTTTLACVNTALATYTAASLGTPGGVYILNLGDETGTFTAPVLNNGAIQATVDELNAAFEDYTFEVVTIAGQDVYGVKITGTCKNFKIESIDDKGNTTSTETTNGYCLDCLDSETTRNLINKIKALCSN